MPSPGWRAVSMKSNADRAPTCRGARGWTQQGRASEPMQQHGNSCRGPRALVTWALALLAWSAASCCSAQETAQSILGQPSSYAFPIQWRYWRSEVALMALDGAPLSGHSLWPLINMTAASLQTVNPPAMARAITHLVGFVNTAGRRGG